MNTLNYEQTKNKIEEIIEIFNSTVKKAGYIPGKMFASIEDVNMFDCLNIYHKIHTYEKRLLLPSEIDDDHYVVIIKPHPYCVIEIRSESVGKVIAHNPKKFNLN